MAVTRNQRALIYMNDVRKTSKKGPFWEFIYGTAALGGLATTHLTLDDDYKFITVLMDAQATKANFLRALKSAAAKPGIKRVDVFMQLHGSTDKFAFHEGNVGAGTLRDDIIALQIPKGRLRLLYNTACFGDSQNNPEMLQAGFMTTIGARKINTTGGFEYPIFCGLWQLGGTVQAIMNVADNPVARAAQDAAAGILLPSQAGNIDSRKIIRGNKNVRITT